MNNFRFCLYFEWGIERYYLSCPILFFISDGAAVNFFSIRVCFHGHRRFTGQQGKGGNHFLSHSTTSTDSRIFRHLFATLHVRWLSHIFNRTTCIYQTATRWNLPPYRITIWLNDNVKLVFVCLLDDLILFLLQQSWYGKPVDSNSHRISPLY